MKKGQTVEYFQNGNFIKGTITYAGKKLIRIKTWLGTVRVTDFSLLKGCY